MSHLFSMIMIFFLGRVYDLNGNLHQWWNNKTIDKFKKRTDCVVNQYSDYSINGKHINGKQTLGKCINKKIKKKTLF